MANTTYQVTLSTDGRHTVTVSSDSQEALEWAESWAKATYDRLVEANNVKTSRQPLQAEATRSEDSDDPPICGIHGSPMVKVQGRRGEFWSCHEKNTDGSWCSYRPQAR